MYWGLRGTYGTIPGNNVAEEHKTPILIILMGRNRKVYELLKDLMRPEILAESV